MQHLHSVTFYGHNSENRIERNAGKPFALSGAEKKMNGTSTVRIALHNTKRHESCLPVIGKLRLMSAIHALSEQSPALLICIQQCSLSDIQARAPSRLFKQHANTTWMNLISRRMHAHLSVIHSLLVRIPSQQPNHGRDVVKGTWTRFCCSDKRVGRVLGGDGGRAVAPGPQRTLADIHQALIRQDLKQPVRA